MEVSMNTPQCVDTPQGGPATLPESNNYWQALINEFAIAEFLGLSVRTIQGFRSKGGGPRFVRISSRCVKYRRIDGREWAEARLCSSTSDQVQGAA